MIIAMVAVGMVKPAANQIVDMVSVWDSPAWTVAVRTTAGVMVAAVGVLIADLDDVLVNMPIVGMMQTAILKAIDVVSMADRRVSTVRAMLVCGGACHELYLLTCRSLEGSPPHFLTPSNFHSSGD